jgi:serine/threonine protein kinase
MFINFTIGRYRVKEKIGKGGMGDVYLGYDEKLDREVALKCIRAENRLNEETKSRFLQEAKILSQLGHPNICQIYDYLETPDAAYLVLELISGKKLSDVIRENKLTFKQKLAILRKVAEVLSVAHEKGVIHRDLKPDNIIFTNDGDIKVLDFGLARQIYSNWDEVPHSQNGENKGEVEYHQKDLTLDAVIYSKSRGLTTMGVIMGTLGYMSPEQAKGEEVTPFSDMYSFGIIVEELFSGKSSYNKEESFDSLLSKNQKGEREAVHIEDSDIEALVKDLTSIEINARLTGREAVKRIDEIIEKPVKRRKKVLISVAISVLTLFAIVATFFWIRAVKAEKIAREAEESARNEAETSRQVSDFLVNIFKVSNPGEARGKNITARELLDSGKKKIENELKNQPLVQARLMETMGTTYSGLGLYDEALPLLENSLKIREKLLKPDDILIARSLQSLGMLYFFQGKYSEVESLYKRALEIREKSLGPNDPEVATSLNALAFLYNKQGKYPESLNLYNRCLKIREDSFGSDNPDVAETLNNLALLYYDQGKYSEAESLYKRSLQVSEKTLGPDHPNVARLINRLAAIYVEQEKYSDAEPLMKRALEIREKTLGSQHPDVAASLNNLALLYYSEGKSSDAVPLLERSLAIKEKALGKDHPDVANSLNNLALVFDEEKRYSDSEPLYKRALEIREKSFGPNHPEVAKSLENLALLYVIEGKNAKAEECFKRGLSICEKVHNSDPKLIKEISIEYAKLLRQTGRVKEAEKLEKHFNAIENNER